MGSNFFLTEDDVGKSKAAVMCSNLHELNPEDTIGEAIELTTEEFINTADFSQFSLIVACEVNNQIAN